MKTLLNLTTNRLRRSPRLLLLASLNLVAGLGLGRAADPGLQADHDHYYPGQDIHVSFVNGPGNPKDWVGVYPVDVVPGSVNSTIWRYVDNTQGGNAGLREGTVDFPGGLGLAGDWAAYLLLNDGYTALATNLFQVIDPTSPLVQADRRLYGTGENITVTFTNGPANAKDWIGVYKVGQTPGPVPSTIWNYVDGTQDGNSGAADGSITFVKGLAEPGNYIAYLLLNDGYDILSSETFTVAAPSGTGPRVLKVDPANGASNVPPRFRFTATVTNSTSQVVLGSVVLKLDNVVVPATATEANGLVTISYTGTTLPAAGSTHEWSLVARDNAAPANEIRVTSSFTIGAYRNIVLPAPLYFESFDDLAEGALPAGWTDASYSTPVNESVDFGDLGSAAYSKWTVVSADRFTGSFVTYGNPDNPANWGTDYQRVLAVNAFNVLNGVVIDQPLAKGRFLFGNSGYANEASAQAMYLFTRDYDLTGKTNVHVAFKSLWEQNQDSLAALEYSIDRGANWLPVVYLLDRPDVVTLTEEGTGKTVVDVIATLTNEQTDTARYTDNQGNEIGGSYGAFIAAPISEALAPFIQARLDNDPVESKRIELFPLPQAAGQKAVRFRFAHVGADSWYWGIDDFGLYQLSDTPATQPTLQVVRDGAALVISWGAASGFTLESSATLAAGSWQAVPGVSGGSYRVTAAAGAQFYRLRQ